MENRSRLLLLVMFLGLGTATADIRGSIPTTVILRQSMPSSIVEEAGIAIDSSGASLTINSNGFSRQKRPAKLGLFKSELSSDVLYLRDLVERAKPSKVPFSVPDIPKSTNRYRSPHRVRILIDGVELEPGSKYFNTVLETARSVLTTDQWIAQDAVSVSVNKDVVTARYLACDRSKHKDCEPFAVSCPEVSAKTGCAVGRFGVVYLH